VAVPVHLPRHRGRPVPAATPAPNPRGRGAADRGDRPAPPWRTPAADPARPALTTDPARPEETTDDHHLHHLRAPRPRPGVRVPRLRPFGVPGAHRHRRTRTRHPTHTHEHRIMSRAWKGGSTRQWRRIRAYVLARDTGLGCRAHREGWCSPGRKSVVEGKSGDGGA